jgi:CheY-like chemotaxis protein
MKSRQILLADDNPNDVELTVLTLAEYNLSKNIDIARDGVEVMDYLHSEGKFKGRNTGNPAVIFLDLKMPRMDGIEVLKAIKSDPMYKFIPVVMLTSSREEKDLNMCYSLGVNAYVVKPVDFNQFSFAIKHLGAFWGILNELP